MTHRTPYLQLWTTDLEDIWMWNEGSRVESGNRGGENARPEAGLKLIRASSHSSQNDGCVGL